MEKEIEEVMIAEKNYPANLQILLDEEKDKDYEIKPVYFLALTHGLMGFFPAIITDSETKRMVIVVDKKLIKKVWEKLSPRKSHMDEDLFYIHKTEPVGYPAKHWAGKEEAKPYHLLTEEEFQKLTKEKEHPFKWTPGLIGNDMSQEEFLDTIKAASENL